MINPSRWLAEPADTRQKLALALDVHKSGGITVVDNKLTCDGHTAEDLMCLTPEKLQAFTGSSETDVYKLFELAVEKVNKPYVQEETKSSDEGTVDSASKPKGRGRKARVKAE